MSVLLLVRVVVKCDPLPDVEGSGDYYDDLGDVMTVLQEAIWMANEPVQSESDMDALAKDIQSIPPDRIPLMSELIQLYDLDDDY